MGGAGAGPQALDAPGRWYAEEGDFEGPDGLLMSGRVPGMPREVAYTADDGSTVVFPVLTRSQASRLNRREESAAERSARIASNRERCFSGEFRELEACRFEGAAPDTDPSALEELRLFAGRFGENRRKKLGHGLILHGQVGRGKTFLAACLCNELTDAGWRCKMTSTREVRRAAEGRFGSGGEAIAALCRNDLVVLDDMFADRDTEWARELAFDVVDALYKLRVPVVATTNMAADGLFSPLDALRPTVDRLKERCRRVAVSGPNRRQTKWT